MNKKLEEKIQKAKEKVKKLNDAKRKAEAKIRSAENAQKRKNENRMKFLIGAFMLDKISKDENEKNKLMSGLNDYLTSSRDRVLFQLLEKSENNSKKEPEIKKFRSSSFAIKEDTPL